jgi:DNA-binding phage protein
MSEWAYCVRMDIATLTGTSNTLAGLALKTGIARNTLRRRLANPGLLTLDEIEAIAHATATDSFEILNRVAEWKAAA